MGERLPQSVKQFLETYIDSVEQLEVLILLREERGRWWTPADVNRRLKTSRSSVELRLGALAERRLLERADATFAYTLDGASDRYVRDVARCFQSRRAAVIETIFAAERGVR
jgi:DNA-binding IclR family transcriptional regulator